MQRNKLTAADIIQCINTALAAYKENCTGFFSRSPGNIGKERKTALELLRDQLVNKTGEEALLDVYDFYMQEQRNSRLMIALYHSLLSVIGVPVPQCTDGLFFFSIECERATLLFQQTYERLKSDLGADEHEKGFMLGTRNIPRTT